MVRKNKILVYDLGITSSKKRKYKNKNFSSYGGILADSSNIGTKVYSKEGREGFYYINKKLKKDSNYEFFFTWVDGHFVTPILQIRESDNMDIFTTFQRTSGDCWQMYTNASGKKDAIVDFQGFKYFKRLKIRPDDQIKLVKKIIILSYIVIVKRLLIVIFISTLIFILDLVLTNMGIDSLYLNN